MEEMVILIREIAGNKSKKKSHLYTSLGSHDRNWYYIVVLNSQKRKVCLRKIRLFVANTNGG